MAGLPEVAEALVAEPKPGGMRRVVGISGKVWTGMDTCLFAGRAWTAEDRNGGQAAQFEKLEAVLALLTRPALRRWKHLSSELG